MSIFDSRERTKGLLIKALQFTTGILFVLLVLAPATTAFAEDVLKIAVIGPMKYTNGQHHWNGASLAAEEINEQGGVKIGNRKYKIQLVRIDTNETESVADAVKAVRSALREADFFIGMERSEAGLAMQDILCENRKLVIACGTAHPELSKRVASNYDKYKYWFRLSENSMYMAEELAAHLEDVSSILREKTGQKTLTVGLIVDKLKWTEPIVQFMTGIVAKLGLNMAGVWYMAPGATDLTSELRAMEQKGVRIIFMISAIPASVVLCRQWGEMRIPAVLIGASNQAYDRTFWDATAGYGKYVTTSGPFGPAEVTPKTMPFWDKYVNRYGQFPNYNALTYDAVHLLKAGFEKSGTTDVAALIGTFESIHVEGASGIIRFQGKDDPFPHDRVWGPGGSVYNFIQWLGKDKVVVVWPYGWRGMKFKGSQRYTLPEWVLEYGKGK